MTVSQDSYHVPDINMNDVMNIAVIIDQINSSYDIKQILNDSIHAQLYKPIVNLPSYNLRYKLNIIRHKSKKERSGFTFIPTIIILEQSRLEKLDYIKYFYISLIGFQDLI